jgi:hypothetical protein
MASTSSGSRCSRDRTSEYLRLLGDSRFGGLVLPTFDDLRSLPTVATLAAASLFVLPKIPTLSQKLVSWVVQIKAEEASRD